MLVLPSNCWSFLFPLTQITHAHRWHGWSAAHLDPSLSRRPVLAPRHPWAIWLFVLWAAVRFRAALARRTFFVMAFSFDHQLNKDGYFLQCSPVYSSAERLNCLLQDLSCLFVAFLLPCSNIYASTLYIIVTSLALHPIFISTTESFLISCSIPSTFYRSIGPFGHRQAGRYFLIATM